MQKIILASAVKRLAAFGFDLLVINFILLYPFSKLIGMAFSSAKNYFLISDMRLLPLVLAISLIYILYFTLFEYALGQTIGKMLTKLVSFSFENKKMSFLQALGRNLFLVPLMPFVFLWVIDPIFIIWKRISISEMITRTITVEVDEKWKIK